MIIKCNTFFLIFFIIKLFNTSEIIIPFTSFLSEIPRNLTPYELMKALIKNELYTNISLGTPHQNLDLIIEIKNYHSYIIKDKESDNKKYKRFYNDSSSTFKILGQKESFRSSDFTEALNISDIITINEKISNFNFIFLQILESNAETKIEYPGLLGFGPIPNSDPSHIEAGLIRQLKEKNLSKNYLYTLVFNRKDDFKGKIIIEKNIYEGYSKDDFQSDYCFCTPDYTLFFWGWNYITSDYNKEKIDIVNVFLKPELGVILMNTKIKDLLNKKFFDEKIKEGKCYEGYHKYTFFFCDEEVKIYIGEFNFKLKKGNLYFSLNTDDLLYRYNNKIYLLIGFGINISQEEVYLGYPFFKKYDVIFDQDKRTVGFYNFKISDKNPLEDNNREASIENNTHKKNIRPKNAFWKKIILGILMIFFILLILYSIFYIYRSIKRKTKGNLLEELNESKNV